MCEYLMIMAYLPWIRLQADRFFTQTLQRTSKRGRGQPNRPLESGRLASCAIPVNLNLPAARNG